MAAELRGRAQHVVSKLELPAGTIARVILTLSIIWLLTRLWSILLLVVIALLVAAALYPPVRWLEQRGAKRSLAVGIVFLTLVAIFALTLGIVVPPLIDDGRAFAEDLPQYVEDAKRLLNRNPDLYDRLQEAAQNGSADPASIFGGFLTVGAGLIGAISNFLIVLVLAIYILVDGERIYEWLVRYLPAKQRDKLDRTIPEVSRVVSGYVAGQLVTSALFGAFAFIVLTALDVPQAMFLAILAAFADAIPIAGVLAATIPTALLGLSVSPSTAVAVVVAYLVYQQIENYIIVPRIYKNTLQISSFAVLIAVLIGGELLGIAGVLLALPIAAAVPVIERIWIEDDHPWRVRARRSPVEPAESIEAQPPMPIG
jgi:predicted PurR-regulated permease PerM